MAEMFDVLNEDAQKTGESLPRDEVHFRELWHGSVHVWIINSEDKILLQFRAANKKIFPNCWDTSVAGHISAGDTPKSAAIREVAEEIGIHITEDELHEVGRTTESLPFIAGGMHNEHNWVFILHKDLDISALQLQKSELQKVKWFSVHELEDILGSPTRRKELSLHDDELVGFAITAVKGSK
jgi:isopentenyl-diphosphate Delta-isomerase